MEKSGKKLEAPDWLGDTAKEVWARAIAGLLADGLYDPRDIDLLANYCIAQGSVIDASRRGEAPQPPLLAQVQKLSVALAIDPTTRRKRLGQKKRDRMFPG